MEPSQELELKKIVWAYMIEAGTVTSGEWSYYRGRWETPEIALYDWRQSSKQTEEAISKVKKYGVNWDKTQAPKASQQNEFNDTFSPSTQVESLLGTIVLNNGESIMFGVSGSETRFSEYAKTLASLMTDKRRVAEVFGE